MKKYLYIVLLTCGVSLLNACQKAEEGTLPGNDTKPVVTAFPVNLGDPDETLSLRVAPNNRVSKFFVLAEPTSAIPASDTKNVAYAQKVVSQGTEYTAQPNTDILVSELYGDNTVTIVGVDASGNMSDTRSFKFTGIKYDKIGTATITTNPETPWAAQVGNFNTEVNVFRRADKPNEIKLSGPISQYYPIKITYDEDGH